MLAVTIHGARLRLSSRLELQSLCGTSRLPYSNRATWALHSPERRGVQPRPRHAQSGAATDRLQQCVSLAVRSMFNVASSQTTLITVIAVCCGARAAVSVDSKHQQQQQQQQQQRKRGTPHPCSARRWSRLSARGGVTMDQGGQSSATAREDAGQASRVAHR